MSPAHEVSIDHLITFTVICHNFLCFDDVCSRWCALFQWLPYLVSSRHFHHNWSRWKTSIFLTQLKLLSPPECKKFLLRWTGLLYECDYLGCTCWSRPIINVYCRKVAQVKISQFWLDSRAIWDIFGPNYQPMGDFCLLIPWLLPEGKEDVDPSCMLADAPLDS